MMGRLTVAIFTALAVLGGIVFFGVYDVGADTPHWAVTEKVIEIARDRAITVRANKIEVPDLSDEQVILKGAGQYAAMCANCHLAPGVIDSEIRPGLYPKPPNLAERVIDPRRVFWVIKHGLKMSGMPAWGPGHDDETLWSIVAFVQKLPGMSGQQYKEIVAKAPPDEEMESMDKGGGETRHQGMSMKDKQSGSAQWTSPKVDVPHQSPL